MTLLYYDERFLDHQTGAHPESPTRLAWVARHLRETGLDDRCARPTFLPASDEAIARVHAPGYVRQIERFAGSGGGWIEVDTRVSTASVEVARLASGAVCDAVTRVMGGEEKNAVCLVRPPGHHALRSAAMGFCLLNHVAVAARLAIDALGVARVLIVDWDVHHGNGTQATFWEDPRVGFLSIHRYPFYPGTGSADETGGGAGLGTTVNLPVSFGTPRADYRERFCRAIDSFADTLRPELILVSAGFDAHRQDPIGSLGLEVEDFEYLTQRVLSVAEAHACGRVISVLEGGYNPPVLAESVAVHLETMINN
jgi:acetoin utilization deacetylase AcuC-like enzyme